MLEKPISPLRQRMIDDMTARRFKEKVQKDFKRDKPRPVSAQSWHAKSATRANMRLTDRSMTTNHPMADLEQILSAGEPSDSRRQFRRTMVDVSGRPAPLALARYRISTPARMRYAAYSAVRRGR
jgi:hypothetical protein